MTYSDFANFLNQRMRERGIAAKRLSDMSGISMKHIEALRHGDIERLPSAPYVRGYFTKLGTALDFDGQEWWEKVKEESMPEELGPANDMPKNRFAQKPVRKLIIIGIAAFLLLSYLGFRSYDIIGKPVIAIDSPHDQMSVVDANWISLKGTAKNTDSFKINGEQIQLGQNGAWEKTVTLEPGINTIEFDAQKFLGRETKVIRQVVYQAPASASTSPSASSSNTK
jgi:Glucodextranase, domain B/Helix-turn-helix domain